MIDNLKRNIRRKWLNSLPNVDFFIEQIEKKSPELDPMDYYYNSEDYFTKVLFLKPISDILFPAEYYEKKRKEENFKNYKNYRLIR